MEQSTQTEIIYDANAAQRYEFEVIEDGQRYDTCHVFSPLSDERYMQFIKSFGKDAERNEIEAYTALWNDLIIEVENLDIEGFEDNWKSLIDFTEKRDSLFNYLSVAVVEPETKSPEKRRPIPTQTETVKTEAFFNFPAISRQTHTLKKADDEWRKKFDRISRRQWREEPTRGLRRQPKMEYVPQNEEFGELYDEMLISAEGFKDNLIPLRFKTTVIHHLFGGSKLGEKKQPQ